MGHLVQKVCTFIKSHETLNKYTLSDADPYSYKGQVVIDHLFWRYLVREII